MPLPGLCGPTVSLRLSVCTYANTCSCTCASPALSHTCACTCTHACTYACACACTCFLPRLSVGASQSASHRRSLSITEHTPCGIPWTRVPSHTIISQVGDVQVYTITCTCAYHHITGRRIAVGLASALFGISALITMVAALEVSQYFGKYWYASLHLGSDHDGRGPRGKYLLAYLLTYSRPFQVARRVQGTAHLHSPEDVPEDVPCVTALLLLVIGRAVAGVACARACTHPTTCTCAYTTSV